VFGRQRMEEIRVVDKASFGGRPAFPLGTGSHPRNCVRSRHGSRGASSRSHVFQFPPITGFYEKFQPITGLFRNFDQSQPFVGNMKEL